MKFQNTSANWLIEPLARTHLRNSFHCGSAQLDEFIRKLARQQQAKHVNRTFVAVTKADRRNILGFYTLSAGSIHFSNLPPAAKKRLPRYPVPVARIGRLAVDQKMRGQGLGAWLLRDALLRIARIAQSEMGIVAVVVDAKDEEAKAFYEHVGFVPLLDRPMTLYLMVDTILGASD